MNKKEGKYDLENRTVKFGEDIIVFLRIMKKKENKSIIRINLQGLDKVSGSAIINLAKTTRYDPLGMAGFCL